MANKQRLSTLPRPVPSHYLFQAVPLLDLCEKNLQKAIDNDPSRRHEALLELKRSILASDQLLYSHLLQLFDPEEERVSQQRHHLSTRSRTVPSRGVAVHDDPDKETRDGSSRSMQALNNLTHFLQEHSTNNAADTDKRRSSCLHNPQEPFHERHAVFSKNTNTKRNAVDTLLFRLIVTLELLLVRIDDAHYVITGHRIDKDDSIAPCSSDCDGRMHRSFLALGWCCVGAGLAAGVLQRNYGDMERLNRFADVQNRRQMIRLVTKVAATLLGVKVVNSVAKGYWMTDKIIRSNSELKEWMEEWELIHQRASRYLPPPYSHMQQAVLVPEKEASATNSSSSNDEFLGLDDKSRRLIEHAMKHGRKSYFWSGMGEIRFLMLKRFMDVYYASVGTAINTKQTSPIALPLVTGAAASFYSITGVSKKSLSGVVNDSSRDLIQHAWGMVSLPALKNLMLQASRLIKGASVADRIMFCGVPCFILSKDPAPELATALQRQAKQKSGGSTANLSQLSTIPETEIHFHAEEVNFGKKNFAGTCGKYRQRDVILHCCGGGFFAHTIATDLPYLLDWSSSTGAVVICPEYALLPENHFPVALNQITGIYSALANGDTRERLGFEVNRICLTGESVGGNLAAALCVKLAMHHIGARLDENDSNGLNGLEMSKTHSKSGKSGKERMPDAIMLSCAALNLTTELSYSRVVGTEDPVLPNALISAISEAYLPPDKGFDKRSPLASPFYASDEVLRLFPPALLFASSKDPLLDDSVIFNERLRTLGVDSELIAAHNVPHAYLGLGTAGFPEAVQVQKYAMDWLSNMLKT